MSAPPLESQLPAEAARALRERYRAAGLKVDTRIYPGARHEILNETNRGEVVADLGHWLEQVIACA